MGGLDWGRRQDSNLGHVVTDHNHSTIRVNWASLQCTRLSPSLVRLKAIIHVGTREFTIDLTCELALQRLHLVGLNRNSFFMRYLS